MGNIQEKLFKFGPVVQEMSLKEKSLLMTKDGWTPDEDRSQYLTLSLRLR